MTPADLARNAAISLEAKKDALTQRQSGDWKISFTVQGIDMDSRLTNAAPGTRYAVVLVEIGDDELPAQKEARAKPDQEIPHHTRPDRAAREKMDWRDMQPAAQAGIRSNEPEFWAFLREETEFNDVRNENQAATAIRNICQVDSRADLSTDHRKRVLWHQLDSQFLAWKAKERVGA
jgi:hypothetical protein